MTWIRVTTQLKSRGRGSRIIGWLGSQALLCAAGLLALGMVLSLAGAAATHGPQQRSAEMLVGRRAAAVAAAISAEVNRYQDTATQLSAALSAQHVTAREFAALTEPLESAHLVGASGVTLVVPAAAGAVSVLQAHWRDAGASGLTLSPIGAGPHYFSVLSRSLDGRATAVGRDLSAAPQLTAALRGAAASRLTTVSDSYVLLKDRGLPRSQRQLSFAMVAPIYAPATPAGPTLPAHPGNSLLVGWVVLGMRGGDLTAATLRNSTQGLLNVTLESVSAAGRRTVADVLTSGVASAVVPPVHLRVPVAQQHWVLTIQDTVAADGLNPGYDGLRQSLFLGGSAFSTALALLLWILLTARRRTLRQVDVATVGLRAAELAARQETTLLEAVLDTISDGVTVLDHRGSYLVANPAARALLNIDPGPLTTAAGTDLSYKVFRADGVTPVPLEDLPSIRALCGETCNDDDLLIRAGPGSPDRWVIASARPLEPGTGGELGSVTVFHDVTRTRALQVEVADQLRDYERLLHLLSDLGEGVIIAEPERFVFVNAAYAALTGYSVTELLTMSPDTVAADGDSLADFARWRRQLRDDRGNMGSMYTRIRRRDGRTVAVEAIGLDIEHGGLRQRVSIIRDLTELHRQQAQLEEHAAELETVNRELAFARDAATEASRAKSAFLASMSHEIRTPMSAVIGITELLLGSDLDEEQRNYLKVVESSGDALLVLLNDILDWSKIESGSLRLEQRAFDLRECIEGALTMLAGQVGPKDLDLLVHVDPDVPAEVAGDETRLRQILINLAGNAIKFTQHGHVLVTASRTLDRSADVDSDRAPSTGVYPLTIRVVDTGIGIPSDKIDRLFRDFSQVDDSVNRAYGGTGLGLAISRRLAEAMNGSITVESRAGVGSTFTVDLRLEAHLPVGSADSDTTPSQLVGRRVLVVDDNPIGRGILMAQLAHWEMSGEQASSGAEALSLLARHRYDIGVFDYGMPGMDGLALRNQLVSSGASVDMPVVMISSMAQREALVNVANPPNRHLFRPVKAGALRSALTDVLAGPSSPGRRRQRTSGVARPAVPRSTLRILVVDDTADVRHVIMRLLERLGYSPDEASGGDEALEVAGQQPYDVILMDMNMPGLDGLATTRRLRQLPPPGPRPWIIAVTGNVLVEDLERCSDAGMDDHLAKPFRTQNLAAVLDRFSEASRAAPLALEL